jgi:hypothetical protein
MPCFTVTRPTLVDAAGLPVHLKAGWQLEIDPDDMGDWQHEILRLVASGALVPTRPETWPETPRL